MKKKIVAAIAASLLVAGCTLGFVGGHRGTGLVIAPALPLTVEIGSDNYYQQSGYFYKHQGRIWMYSQSRQGPWMNLPRSHYPRRVHYVRRDNRGYDRRR